MGFNISFDYRFDTSGFYTSEVRQVLEAAASIWEAIILDEFDDIAAGHEFTIRNPETDRDVTLTLTDPIDDLLIFVGSRSSLPGSTLATGGFTSGSSASIFAQRLKYSDFEPYIGTLCTDRSRPWFFDDTPSTSNDIPEGKNDFLTIALHEIGHALGMGTASASDQLLSGGLRGFNLTTLNQQIPVSSESDGGHFKEGIFDDATLMDPSMTRGKRQLPSKFDMAWLADIGYQVADYDGISFVTQGSQPPLTGDGNDRVDGTELADLIDGLSGNDTLAGWGGADELKGGAGLDKLWGGPGHDSLSGGDGSDELSGDGGRDVLDGGAAGDQVWGGPDKDLLFGGQGDDRLSGEEQEDRIDGGTDNDKLWGGPDNDYLWGGSGDDYLEGEEGEDTLIGWSGNDSLWGKEGADVFVFFTNNGTDKINDFNLAEDLIELDPKLGYASGSDFLTRSPIQKPFSNVSRLSLGGGNFVDVMHDSMTGSPLQASHVRIASTSLDKRFSPLLSSTTISESTPAGSVVTLLSTDQDPLLGEMRYELVNGDGDRDNARFTIVNNGLTIRQSPLEGSERSYAIRVRATSNDGFSTERALSLQVSRPDAFSANQAKLDLTGDNNVDTSDARLLMAHLLGTFPITSLLQQLPNSITAVQTKRKLDNLTTYPDPAGTGLLFDISFDKRVTALEDGIVITSFISQPASMLSSWTPPSFLQSQVPGSRISDQLRELAGWVSSNALIPDLI